MKLIKLLFYLTFLIILVALLEFISWQTLGIIIALMIGLMIAGFTVFLIFTSITSKKS